ncbi:FG-GAP-like repeat-containing protein [Streptomyces sp. NPDC051183]|uniref:FG-GAP-like repeat-containing protein n=1 Tax=Streptomyces sp. NPDC051183 TaxID=3155165 RepID=UPI003421BF4D
MGIPKKRFTRRSRGLLLTVAAVLPALGTVLSAAPAQAGAATVRPAAPEIRVVSWNICGEAGGDRGDAGYCPYRDEPAQKMDQVKQLVDEQRANVVMLQEVCGEAPDSHMALLQARLGAGWSIRHAAGARPDGRTDCRAGLTGQLGVLLAVKGEITSAVSENTLPAGDDRQTLPALCASVAGWTTTVCTTHIVAGQDQRAAEQIKHVKAFLDRNGPNGVVVGGDFNRNAGAPAMEPLTGGYDRCIEGTTYHGWDTAAKAHAWHRLDHLFTTRAAGAGRFASCSIDASRMDVTENEPAGGAPSGYSDHAPVTGVLRGAPVPGDMTGDGKPDLLAVDDAGRLRLYRGDGTGAVTGSPAVIGSGGWTGSAVTHRGDWTGDGHEDVVARIGGELRVYPGRGDGTLASPVRIAAGLPATAQVVGVGDATGDGHPDLVATIGEELWLYAGDPAARPAVKPAVRIGNGGWAVMTLTAPGDADHDGRPDLLARDTRDGRLWLYRGRSDGGFDARTQYGHGYGTANRPLIAGGADADGNGTADMWTTTGEGTGTLMFYAGEANGAGDPVDGTRTTVGQSGWNTVRSIS